MKKSAPVVVSNDGLYLDWIEKLGMLSMNAAGVPLYREHLGEARIRALFDRGLTAYQALKVLHGMGE